MGELQAPDAAALSPLAALIQAYLSREGMSAYQLARRMNVSPQTVSNLLYKQLEPLEGTLALLSQATGIPLDELRTAAGKDRVDRDKERARLAKISPRTVNALYDDMRERLADVDSLTHADRERLYAAIEQARRERLGPLGPLDGRGRGTDDGSTDDGRDGRSE